MIYAEPGLTGKFRFMLECEIGIDPNSGSFSVRHIGRYVLMSDGTKVALERILPGVEQSLAAANVLARIERESTQGTDEPTPRAP